MALAGNGRWTWLDPKLGAMHAVAEAARKVACTGATPVAATNCLNFGNPEKPEIMAQLSAAIDGIAEACNVLGTPVTGGNVSLYNETKGEGIYPTPVIGIVGIIDDVTKAVPSSFQAVGDKVLLLQSTQATPESQDQEFGSSAFAKKNLGTMWGTPPFLDINAESALHRELARLAERGLIHSAKDISDGGLAVALAEAGFKHDVGVRVTLGALQPDQYTTALFAENATEVLVTCDFENYGLICTLLDETGEIWPLDLGETIADRVEIFAGGVSLVEERFECIEGPVVHGAGIATCVGGACLNMADQSNWKISSCLSNTVVGDDLIEDEDDATPFDKLREECGVMAVYNHPDAARMTYWGLYSLQHRGQESAGIASADGSDVNDIKGMGLVSEIFTDDVLAKLPGHMAIGHTRYSTTGDSALLNAQPISVETTQGPHRDCAQRQPGEPGQFEGAAGARWRGLPDHLGLRDHRAADRALQGVDAGGLHR